MKKPLLCLSAFSSAHPPSRRGVEGNPDRIGVIGFSAGGELASLVAMHSNTGKPELFSAYIAATPAVVAGDDWLAGYEEAFAKSGRRLTGRLSMSGGGNESPGFLGGIGRFNERIASRNPAGLAYGFRIIEGERRAGMQFEA